MKVAYQNAVKRLVEAVKRAHNIVIFTYEAPHRYLRD